jgi:choline-sulfatase
MAMVGNKRWKYVFMTGKRDLGLEYATGFGAPGITHFLYDMENDPGETTNLADRAGNREILEDLQHELLRWFIETHPDSGVMPERLTLEGRLAWFCEPRDVGAEHGGVPLRVFRD